MMKLLIIALVAVTTVLAKDAQPAARSIILPGFKSNNCQWQIPSNPCVINPLKRLNFPHPADLSKFIQCGTGNRMFIVQCPPGEQFDQPTAACANTAVVAKPPSMSLMAQYGVTNPCTQQNILLGRTYFSLPYHAHNFIQCEANGNAKVMTCAAQTVWDEARLSCVFPRDLTNVVALPLLTVAANPCTTQAIQANALFFSHPDATKFIQCDLEGNAFVQNCPMGLVWNQYLETCASQQATYTVGANQSG